MNRRIEPDTTNLALNGILDNAGKSQMRWTAPTSHSARSCVHQVSREIAALVDGKQRYPQSVPATLRELRDRRPDGKCRGSCCRSGRRSGRSGVLPKNAAMSFCRHALRDALESRTGRQRPSQSATTSRQARFHSPPQASAKTRSRYGGKLYRALAPTSGKPRLSKSRCAGARTIRCNCIPDAAEGMDSQDDRPRVARDDRGEADND